MDDNQESGQTVAPQPDGATWPDVFREFLSKIPEAYQKSLLKAGIRLIHSGTTYATTWINTQSRELESQQKAREVFRDAIVKKAGKEVSNRPPIVDRAVNYYIDDVLGRQENREAVVAKSVEFLAEVPAPPQASTAPEEVDPDWLDGLARHAENASSERMRTLFGKILAGEIRSPGKYSLFTLDQLTKLSRADTELIVRVAPFVLFDMVVQTPWTQQNIRFPDSMKLAEIGIFNPLSAGALTTERTWQTLNDVKVNNRPAAIVAGNGMVMIVTSHQPTPIKFPCVALTGVGREILTLFNHVPDEKMLAGVAALLASQGAELLIGNLVGQTSTSVSWDNLRTIAPSG